MNPSGNPEPFEGEYAARLRDALSNATVPSLRDFGLRLVGAGVPVSSVCRLHQRALARLTAEVPGLETHRAGEMLAEVLSAYDDVPRAEKPPAEPLGAPTAFFRQLFDEHPFPMWVFEEASLRFLTVNQAAIEVYGYSREEFLTRTILDIRPDDDRDRVVDFIFNRSTDHPAKGEWRHRLKDGRIIDVEISSRRFLFEEKPARLVVARDITDRKRTEERLRLLEAAISNANDVVMITEGDETDPLEGKIIYVNHAFERVLGFSREEAIGNTPRMLQGPGTSPETPLLIQRALIEQRTLTAEILNYRRDGSEIWLELAIQPVRDATGRCTHWLSIQRDITDRRREEERLRQAQKMEAVGQLTAGIAHNFNNLLTVVQGNAELIGRRTPMNDSLGRKKEAILTAAQRGAELVRQLMVISRGSSGAPRPLDVNALVSETGSLVERILPANIRLFLQLADEPLSANLDAVEFSQSLLNLIVNARDAMPHGGDLTITTRRREVAESRFNRIGTVFLLDREKVREGNFVEVAVSDTGVGMTEAVRRRIFEPFFTTKPDGQGTGLGLATTLGFVSERGGFVEVTSEVGRGAIFRLFLPASRPVRPQPVPARAESGMFPILTILVAEDDPAVRRLVTIILEEKGFRVLTAKDGAEAIRVATEFPDPIHLVLTDKAMPTLYGDAVIRLLSDLRPECRFILTSGGLGAPENLPSNVRFLPKPFGRDELLDAIRAVIFDATE